MWAYSQVMIESYKTGKIFTQKQAASRAKQIAIEVNGKIDWDSGGWPQDRNVKTTINSFNDVTNVLNNGPAYAYFSNGKGESHLVVAVGYISGLRDYVIVNNPWKGGVFEIMTYSGFLKGYKDYGMEFKAFY